MSNRRINADMVRLARDIREWTQETLAEKADVAQATISRVEMSDVAANDGTIDKIAAAMSFPIEFFYQDERYAGLGISTIFYRKKSTALRKYMKRLQAEVNLRRIVTKALLSDVEINTPYEFRFYDIDQSPAEPEQIASMVRANWKLPLGPINNLTKAIENAGGIVFRFPFGTTDIDALSQWPDDCPPLFFVNSDAPADRTKFSLAHELAHITMHASATETMEDEANRFAGELLMPAQEIRSHLLDLRRLAQLADMKPYWQVSMGALLYQARKLECISPSRYRRLWMDYTQLGYKKREPNSLQHEHPQFIKTLIRTHIQGNDSNVAALARYTKLSEDDFRLRYLQPDGLRLAG